MGDFPLMTDNGTFIINGAERVVVSQLVRSPGVYFTAERTRPPAASCSTPSSSRTAAPGSSSRPPPATSSRQGRPQAQDRGDQLLRARRLRQQRGDLCAVRAASTPATRASSQPTLDKDPTNTRQEALIEFYKQLRPGDPPTADNAEKLLESLFFNFRRYDLGHVGRYKVNKRLRPSPIGWASTCATERTITKDDLVAIVARVSSVNNGKGTRGRHRPPRQPPRARRRRADPEPVPRRPAAHGARGQGAHVDPGARQGDADALINIRPVVAAMREFFGGSQLRQFMDQTNPLAELTTSAACRRSARAVCRRERAGFDVRDVHHSHYGRICPIETPEGPNIGLIGSLATYGRINEYGFIETPYRKVQAQGRDGTTRASAPRSPTPTSRPKTARSSLKKGEAFTTDAIAELKKQKAARVPRPAARDRRDRLPDRRRGGSAHRRPGQRARSTTTATSPTSSSRPATASVPGGAPSRSTTWTSRPSRSCRWRRRSSRSSSTTTPTAR